MNRYTKQIGILLVFSMIISVLAFFPIMKDTWAMSADLVHQVEVVEMDSKTSTILENDAEAIADALQIELNDFLRTSVKRLYERGCAEVSSVKITREESGWIYFIVEDAKGNIFYADTNKKGNFGTVLSQAANDNVQFIANNLGIEITRNLLYSAERLETCGCGEIVSIDTIMHRRAYRFTIVNDDGDKYKVRMSTEGVISEITDSGGAVIYAPLE